MSNVFIAVENDIFISASTITKIKQDGPSPLDKAILETKNGNYRSIDDLSSVLHQLEPIIPIIPAAPDWTLLQYLYDNGDVLTFPIIGWRYNNDKIWPIHIDEYLYEIVKPGGSRDYVEYVMSPIGTVVDTGNCSWNTYGA